MEARIRFRPLRGLSIPQCKKREEGKESNKFPSPSGTIYSSISVRRIKKVSLERFRPLRGLSIPQWQAVIWMIGRRAFPSPSGTIYSSMQKEYDAWKEEHGCFRPLRGLSIPQCLCRREVNKMAGVSVPFGDYLFLNQEKD